MFSVKNAMLDIALELINNNITVSILHYILHSITQSL